MVLDTFTKNKTAQPATKALSESLRISGSAPLLFVAKVLAAYFLLLHWLYPSYILNSWFNKALCYVLTWSTHLVLGILNIPHSLANTLISVDGLATLYVCTPCSGLDFVWLLGIVVFSYSGSFVSKMSFWMRGTMVIGLLNIVRITALSLIHRYWLPLFEINHHLVFNLIIYGSILWMFLRWAGKANNPKDPTSNLQIV